MDMRSPFVISLSSLPRQEGSSTTWEATIPAPADLGVEMIGVPEESPLAISLSLQSVSEGAWVSGTVDAQLHGQCARCLRDIDYEEVDDIGELFFYPERRAALADEDDDEADELPVIEEDHIDLEPTIRDAIVVKLPFRPLCRPDCPGLCPECGERWDDLPEDHHHEQLNHSFDALADLEEALRSSGDDK